MVARKDLTGQRFGRLVVQQLARPWLTQGGQHKTCWACKCDCGVDVVVRANHLLTNATLSCGCLHSERSSARHFKHGLSHTTDHVRWLNILSRCYNPKDTSFDHYGGRGIVVCERWRESFNNFYADMGPCPSPEHSIERQDNDGPYSPANCIWATREVQANNKRTSLYLEVAGRRQTLAQWSRECGLTHSAILRRLQSGWTAKDAVTLPRNSTYRRRLNSEVLL